MKNDLSTNPVDVIVTHEYLARKGKSFVICRNVKSLDDLATFLHLLDIGEMLCTCSEASYKKVLPGLKDLYSDSPDGKKELRFIAKQRKLRTV